LAFVLVAVAVVAQVPRMVEAQVRAPALKPGAQAPVVGPSPSVPSARFIKIGGRIINMEQVAYVSLETNNAVSVVFAGGAPLMLTGQEAAAMNEFMASMMEASR
jgi:hypothetical protein